MANIQTEGVEAARKHLPALLDRAHSGEVTIVTKRGIPYAAITPVGEAARQQAGADMLSLRGSGKKFWGKNVPELVNAMRSEWD